MVCMLLMLLLFKKVFSSAPSLFYLQGGVLNSHTAVVALLTNLPYTTSSSLGLALLIMSMILYRHQARTVSLSMPIFINLVLNMNVQDTAEAIAPFTDISNVLLLNSMNKMHPPLLYICLVLLLFMIAPHYNFTRFCCTKPCLLSMNPSVNYVLQPLLTANWLLLTFAIGAWWALQMGTWGGWWAWDISELLLLYVTASLCFYLHMLYSKLQVKSMQAGVTLMLMLGMSLWSLSSNIFYTNLHSFFSDSVLLVEHITFLSISSLIWFLKSTFTPGRASSIKSPRPDTPPAAMLILIILMLTLMFLFNIFSIGITLAALTGTCALLSKLYTHLSNPFRSFQLSGGSHLIFLLFMLKTLTSSQTPFSFFFDVLGTTLLSASQFTNSLSEVSFMFKELSLSFRRMSGCSNTCPESVNFDFMLLSDSSSAVGLLTDKTFSKKPGALFYSGFHEDMFVFLL